MKPVTRKILLQLIGVILGAAIGAFLVFQVLFLSKVLPHGGLW